MKESEWIVFLDEEDCICLPVKGNKKTPHFYSISRRNDGTFLFKPLYQTYICKLCRCEKDADYVYTTNVGFICGDCFQRIKNAFQNDGCYSDENENSAKAEMVVKGKFPIPKSMLIDCHFPKITTETPIRLEWLENGNIIGIPLPQQKKCLNCTKEISGEKFLTPLGYICSACADLLDQKARRRAEC